MALARPLAAGQFLFVAFAFGCLACSFVANDFSVLNVATNSNSQLPLHYRIAATWGSHEGSMLLWVLMLGVVDARRRAQEPPPARRDGRARARRDGPRSRSASCCSCCSRRIRSSGCSRRAADGRDLNPLLQDPGMVFHPPLLYMGYVGFSVAFAFAIAALLGGRLDATWARWSRPWTTLAWSFLTCGIMLGSCVGVLRARLGRLVVLGSGRERVVHAVARRHRADPFARGHREARRRSRRGRCCSRSARSRCRCSARSSCARAC